MTKSKANLSRTQKRFRVVKVMFVLLALALIGAVLYARNNFYGLTTHGLMYGHKVYLEPRNEGLRGGNFMAIHASPTEEDHLLALGEDANFISTDGGENWSRLRLNDWTTHMRQMPAYWDWDGTLLVMSHNNMYWSNTQGRTWKHQFLGWQVNNMGLLDDGRAFVRSYRKDNRNHVAHLLERDGSGQYSKGERLGNVEVVLPGRETTIKVGDISLKAVVTKTPSGKRWAATNRGVYLQTQAEGVWEPRNNGLDRLEVKAWFQHPSKPDHVLLTDSGGVVWQSQDFGHRWKRIEQGPIKYARWLGEPAQETLLLITEDFRFIFVSKGERKEVTLPEDDAFVMLYKARHQFHHGVSEAYLRKDAEWRKGFEKSKHNIDICQHRLTPEGTLEVELSSFCDLEGNYGVVWSYTKDGTWSTSERVNHSPSLPYRTESFENGSCVLLKGSASVVSLEQKGEHKRQEIAHQFSFVSTIERAGWHGDKYFAWGDEGILFGSKDEMCMPVYPSFFWSWGWRDWDSEQRYGTIYLSESLYWWEGESMHLLMPGKGGFWGVSLPRAAEERTWSLPKVLHTVSYDRWVQLSFVLLFIFVFLGVRERFYPGQLKRFLTRLQGGRKTPKVS